MEYKAQADSDHHMTNGRLASTLRREFVTTQALILLSVCARLKRAML